ncbi:A-kinase-interacting protein 1 isoform X2 [Carlito syrichta]|uniref:A-kinase-interacting protein 1 isoform X2 n=1 Tax=Carlito syrichta TaxID=1868482 RepID=A0A1U7TIF5_CARSF|nr:A-kinase-interacting protein 1 isoform X2 [Carlito syrichta]
METCLAAAALNGVDRRSLQRSARLGREVLERARRRAVDWHSLERPRGSLGVLSREVPCQERRPAAGPQRLLPGERYYSSVPEAGGAAHVYRYHRGKSKLHICTGMGNGQRKDREKTSLCTEDVPQMSEPAPETSQLPETIFKDLYIEVYPGTYSVTVGSNNLTKTHVVAVDSGQSVDLVFPV